MPDEKTTTTEEGKTPEAKASPKAITRSELSAMIADEFKAGFGGFAEQLKEELKPVVASVKDPSEQVLEDEKNAATIRGEPQDAAILSTVERDIRKGVIDSELKEDEFSFVRAVQAQSSKDWRGAEHEMRVFDRGKRKAATLGTDSAGGYLVPTMDLPENFIEQLNAKSVCIEAGCEVWDNLMGSPVNVPKETSGYTVYWIGEGTITESNAVYGQLQLTPHQCADLVKVSRLLLENNAIAAEAFIRRRLQE
jgi:HK97 family phage major capsid protein